MIFQGPKMNALSELHLLSRNLWWSWDLEAVSLWEEVAERLGVPETELSPRNPARLLSRSRKDALERLVSDEGFRARLHRIFLRFQKVTKPRPPREATLRLPGPVAYFSMEFGVHESLPIYAGGLGILAGDHAKTASDLGIPLVGVGLFYWEGYFRQEMDGRGRHVVTYPRSDRNDLPLEPFRDSRGREIRVKVELPGRKIHLKLWRVQVGRVNLILLDADIPENSRRDRTLTRRLYTGNREERIIQEVLCGIGGVRALRALNIEPALWHLNEGHVAFLTLERIRELTGGGKMGLAEAVEVISADTLFTTHTPVPEGNEIFSLNLARRHLDPHCRAAGIPVEEYLKLGLDGAGSGRPVFSMTVLAVRLSRFRNGVSRLHGEVSRRMWAHLWPGLGTEDVPIGSVTNGIHIPTWISPAYSLLYSSVLGERWIERLHDPKLWSRSSALEEEDLWDFKSLRKVRLIGFIRDRIVQQLVKSGRGLQSARRAADKVLHLEAFTIGFSRRFALYKRAGLLFRDLRQARRLFNDPRRPVQIIFAGKPHPEDPRGQALFNEISAISRRKEFTGRVVLLSNYDMEIGRYLVQGVDLWLNSPRRPLEACGTSGQKVPINGGLNLSILDGWWDEGYTADAGWAFGKPIEYEDSGRQDREDHRDLFRVLTKEVLPLYFRRDRNGIPRDWIRLVKSSLPRLFPRFSSAHMIRQYIAQYYRPAAANGRRIRAAGAREARRLAAWRQNVERARPLIHVVGCKRTRGGRRVEVDVFIGGLALGDLSARVLGIARDRRGKDSGPAKVSSRILSEGVVRYTFPARAGKPVSLQIWPRHPSLPHPFEMGMLLEVIV